MPIRLRLALTAALVTLVIFGVGGALFATRFERGQRDAVDRGLRTQADTLARRLREPGSTLDLSAGTGAVATGNVVVQHLDDSGTVLDSTREAGTDAVVDRPVVRRALSTPVFTDVATGREGEPTRVIVRALNGTGDRTVLVVGTSLEETNAATSEVTRGVFIGGALAVVLAALGGWLIAGLALHPVERMRREAAEISEHDADAALRVPRTRDEIAALAHTLNEMLARLQLALRQQRDFVADAGHELRTPLSVLRTELELAGRAGRSPTELREAIAHAAAETERLSRLADTLLFLARGDSGHLVVDRSPVDMATFVADAVTAWTASAAAGTVRLRAAVDDALVWSIDGDLARRAVDNLVHNALRHTPAGSSVTIAATTADAHLLLTVSDEGPGFPSDFLAQTFERFRRADDSRTRADGGAGLGLAIVDSIAHAHGGSVAAGSGTDGGAEVSLRIPVPSDV